MIDDVLSPPDRFGPLADDHPAVGEECPGCGEPLQPGDRPSLVNGTPASEEDAAKAAQGRAHTAQAVIAHQTCAYPPAMKHPSFEDMLDLTATLEAIDDLIEPADNGWRPELHVEWDRGNRFRLWFGPDPAVVYHLSVTVPEES